MALSTGLVAIFAGRVVAQQVLFSPALQVIPLGFDASALSASGASASDVERIIAVASAASADFESIREAKESLAAARMSLGRLEDAIRRNGSTVELLSSRDAARADVTARSAACATEEQDLRQQLYAALESQLTPNELTTLEHCVENHDCDVTAQYRVLSLTDAEWATLRSALTKSSAGNQDLTPAESQLLAAANSNPDVVLATQRLQQNLPAIEQAFNTAIAQSLQQP